MARLIHQHWPAGDRSWPHAGEGPMTMTRKIFWQEACGRDLKASIASVAGHAVTLDRTIFFAFSGDQESDHGIIGGKATLEACKCGR